MKEVFLSSVSQGMEPYREAVYRAINRLDGYHCVGMEDFGARQSRSEEFCSQKVSACDCFVGILGHQYGSCPDGSTRSFSELEYDVAVDTKKPRFMFVAPKDFPVHADLIEVDAIREKQRVFKEKVSRDITFAKFQSPETLAAAVMQAIHNHQEERVASAAAAESHRATTWLLFAFVTNQCGFDTGLSVSNISAAPFNPCPQKGPCTIYFYGANAPASTPISELLPGERLRL
jgi:hypothetical protein